MDIILGCWNITDYLYLKIVTCIFQSPTVTIMAFKTVRKSYAQHTHLRKWKTLNKFLVFQGVNLDHVENVLRETLCALVPRTQQADPSWGCLPEECRRVRWPRDQFQANPAQSHPLCESGLPGRVLSQGQGTPDTGESCLRRTALPRAPALPQGLSCLNSIGKRRGPQPSDV